MLEAKDLSYSTVLRGLNFALAPGEMVGLVGANGSGKSTLLRLLSGLLPADSGQLNLDGVSSDSHEFTHQCRSHLGLVANTVDEEVAFGPGQ